MTKEDLEKELNQSKLKGIYLLYGQETYLLEKMLKKIKKTFGELIAGINYITISENNIENLIPNIETPAFGYEKKLIIVKDSKLFKKNKKEESELDSIKDNINDYIKENIKDINDNLILIFIEEEIDKQTLFKTIEDLGVTCNFEKLQPIQLMQEIKKICNQYEVNIDNYTLQVFVEKCGTNMQILINEIRKLIEYVGKNGTIKQEDIDKLSIKELDSIIFDLTDSLGKKNIKEALIILDELLYNKEAIQKILIILYGHFKKLYLVKLSETYNKNIAEILNLNSKQMFLVNKYKNQAKCFKEKELRKILEELINLDFNNKSGLIDINIGLESILATYCS